MANEFSYFRNWNWSAKQKANFSKTGHLIHFNNQNLYSRTEPKRENHNFIHSPLFFFWDVDNFFLRITNHSFERKVMQINSFIRIWIFVFITFRSCNIQIDARSKIYYRYMRWSLIYQRDSIAFWNNNRL